MEHSILFIVTEEDLFNRLKIITIGIKLFLILILLSLGFFFFRKKLKESEKNDEQLLFFLGEMICYAIAFVMTLTIVTPKLFTIFDKENEAQKKQCKNYIISWEEGKGFNREEEWEIICSYTIDKNGCCTYTYEKITRISGKITTITKTRCGDFEIEDYPPK